MCIRNLFLGADAVSCLCCVDYALRKEKEMGQAVPSKSSIQLAGFTDIEPLCSKHLQP